MKTQRNTRTTSSSSPTLYAPAPTRTRTAGVCHRDISLENILMDTRMPDRSSASCRSSSVSSVGSCISVASSAFSCDDSSNGSSSNNDNGSPGSSCFGDAGAESEELAASPREDVSNNSGIGHARQQAEREKARANGGSPWIGRPRLCDFGMSVRIPRSKSGATARLRIVTSVGNLSIYSGSTVCLFFAVFRGPCSPV